MTVMDAEQRRKLIDALLRKAEAAVRQMRTVAQGGDADRVDAMADAMAALLKEREFPSQRATEFRETVKGIQRDAHCLCVDQRLSEAERLAHGGDEKGRNERLAKAKEQFAKAIRFGADEEFRHGVERRVQAVLLTTRDGVDDRTKQAAKRRLEQHDTGAKPPDGIEHRRAIRYMDPVLAVTADGVRFTTINWSTRGLLIEPYRDDLGWSPGDRLRLDLSCAELPGVGGRQTATVVRIDEERHALALSFPDISTVVLALMHALKDAGIKPEPER